MMYRIVRIIFVRIYLYKTKCWKWYLFLVCDALVVFGLIRLIVLCICKISTHRGLHTRIIYTIFTYRVFRYQKNKQSTNAKERERCNRFAVFLCLLKSVLKNVLLSGLVTLIGTQNKMRNRYAVYTLTKRVWSIFTHWAHTFIVFAYPLKINLRCLFEMLRDITVWFGYLTLSANRHTYMPTFSFGKSANKFIIYLIKSV